MEEQGRKERGQGGSYFSHVNKKWGGLNQGDSGGDDEKGLDS